MAMLLLHSSLPPVVVFYILFHASMVTLFTLVLNGIAMPYFYKFLSVYPPKPVDEKGFKSTIGHIDHHGDEMFDIFKEHWFFCDLDKKFMDVIIPPLATFPTLLSDTKAACKMVKQQPHKIEEALRERFAATKALLSNSFSKMKN